MIRGTFLILLALFIDLLQVGISLGIALLAAAPGTVLGAALGATGAASLCSYVGLGSISGLCATIGGAVVGFFGSSLNALAVVTEPVGLIVGFAINMALSIGLGSLLLTFMFIFLQKIYVKNLFFGLGEILPGINNIPFWTAFVIVSLLKHSAEKGSGVAKAATMVMAPTSVLGKATGGIMKIKERTTNIVDEHKALDRSPMEYVRREKNIQDTSGDRLGAQARASGILGDTRERDVLQKTRNMFNDIRPIRTAAALLLAFALAGAGTHTAYAQAVDPIRFVISPEIPQPGDRVTIEAQGVGGFLGDATITWQEDGATVLSGAGERRFTTTVGSLGTVKRVHVSIQSPTHGGIERDFALVPSVVHLLWEADTSVPPLYRGKALYSAGSGIKVVALPQIVSNGTTISFNNLSFQWKINGNAAANQSGLGRSSITLQGSQLRATETVSVEIYLGTAAVGRASITVPAINPELALYIKDPLRGVLYDQALPFTVSLASTEITLQAQPYYFANESLFNGAASYAWTLNNNSTTGPESAQGALTLRQTGEGGGEGQVEVELQNTDPTKFVQTARTALRILFNGTSAAGSGSSFGL